MYISYGLMASHSHSSLFIDGTASSLDVTMSEEIYHKLPLFTLHVAGWKMMITERKKAGRGAHIGVHTYYAPAHTHMSLH